MVNTNRLVETSITILRLLLDKNLHYNEIIRQTSPDRTHVDNAIDVLEGGQLIMEFKMSRRERKQQNIHSQARLMQITDLGRELIDILVSLEQYKKAYYELTEPVKEYFDKWTEPKRKVPHSMRDDVQLDAMRNKVLRGKGFTDEDLEFFEDSDHGTTMILGTFEQNILEIIIVRCVLRLYSFHITDIARDILNNIIVNAVNFRLSILLEFINKSVTEEERGNYADLYMDFAEDLIDEMQAQYYFPALIHKEVKNAILSYLSLLKAPKENVEDIYESIKSNLEKRKNLPLEQLKKNEHLLNLPKRVICLFDAYQAYMRKST